MPRGRVRVLDDTRQREVCALLSAGCSLQAAAQYIECAPNTIRCEAARDPDFGRRFREARLQAQLSPLQAMRKAANSHWRAAAWMLERSDPEHFGHRPPPAFRPQQAETLKDDILAILNAEIDNPILLRRVRNQIQLLMQYSIDGVVKVERTNHQLRAIMRELDEVERKAEKCGEAAFAAASREVPPTSAPFASAPSATAPSTTTPPANPNAKSDANFNPTSQRVAPSAPSAPKTGPTGAPQLDPKIADIPVTWGDMTNVLRKLHASPLGANGQPVEAPPEAPSADADSPPQPTNPTT